MTFLNVSLAYLGKVVQPQSASLSFGLTAKYEFENKFSISIWYLTTKCVLVCPQCKIFYVGDEYRSKAKKKYLHKFANFSRHSLTVPITEICIISNIQMKKKNLFCNQNDGKKGLIIFNSYIKVSGCWYGPFRLWGRFGTGSFWYRTVLEVDRFDPHPCEPVWLSFSYTKTFFFLIINITNRNKKTNWRSNTFSSASL